MPTNNATNTSNPVAVAQGGLGVASNTAYAVLCGGTTSTGAVQSIAALGSSADILTSNGASALPTFQTQAGQLVLIQTQAASNSATLDFTTGISTTDPYYFLITGIVPITSAATFQMQVSSNSGGAWTSTGYLGGCTHFAYTSIGAVNNNSTSSFQLSGPLSSAAGNNYYNAQFYFYNANVASLGQVSGTVAYFDNTASAFSGGVVIGAAGAQNTNAFRFLMSSGNISSGTISLYRVKST